MNARTWAAAFGIIAALLLVIAFFVPGETPDGDANAEEWVEYIEDYETLVLVRAYLLIAAGLGLVAFYFLGVEPRLSGPETTDRAMAHLGGAAAVLTAGALSFTGLIGAAVGAAHLFGDVPIDARTAALFDNLFYGGLLVGSAVPSGVVMLVVAIEAGRRKAFPVWVLFASLVGVLGMAAALVFFPFILLPIWLIAVSIAVAMARDPESSSTPA